MGKNVVNAVVGTVVTAAGILTGQAWLASVGISMVLGAGANALAGQTRLAEEQGSQLTNSAAPLEALSVIYGETMVGAPFADLRQDPTNKNILWAVYALAVGSEDGSGIEEITGIWFDGVIAVPLAVNDGELADTNVSPNLTRDGNSYLRYAIRRGTDAQYAPGDLTDAFAGTAWPYLTSRGRGIAYTVLRLRFHEDIYTQIPRVTFTVRGQRVWDPRTDTVAWSDNPALCILDYLMSARYGCGVPAEEIDTASFEAAANYCDELVNTTGYTGKRFTTNGSFSTAEEREAVLQKLLLSCRGELVYQGGSFRLVIRQPTTASAYALTEDDIVGDIEFVRAGSSVPNMVTAAYIDPDDGYQAKEVPWPEPDQVNAFLTADNGIPSGITLELPFTNDRHIAQQIGMTALRESREDVTISCAAKEAALQLAVGDVVAVTHSTPGWSGKLFWVAQIGLRPDALVNLVLREYDAGAYSLDTQDVTPTVPGSELPDPFAAIAPPSALVLTSDATTALPTQDGQYVPRIHAAWAASPHAFLDYYEVEYRQNSALLAWQPAGRTRELELYISPVTNGVEYEVRVRAVSTLGRASDWLSSSDTTSTQPGPRDPFGTVTAYVDDTGALMFSAHGNEDGVSFRWAASKTALPSTPNGTVNARESLAVDSGITLAEGETGYVAVWWYSAASGGGAQGRRVGAQVVREGTSATPTTVRIREYQWRFTFGGAVDRFLDLTLSYDASVQSIRIIYSDASDPSPEPSIGATYTFNVPSPGPTAVVETVKQADGTTEQTWDLTVRPDVLIAIHAYDALNGTGNEVGGDQLIARQDAGTQPVIVGGTGKTELAAGAILVGEGTDPVTELTGTTAGQVARWNGTRFVAADLDWDDIANMPTTFPPSAHAVSHAIGGGDAIAIHATQVSDGQFANARISQSSVVQHQAALTIAPSQLSSEVMPDRGGTGLQLDNSTPDSLLQWDQGTETFIPRTLAGSGYLRWTGSTIEVASIPGTVASAPGEGRAYVSTGSGVSAHGWSAYTVPTAAQWSAADVGAPLVRTAQGYAFGELPWSQIESATIPVYATRWPTLAEIGAAASLDAWTRGLNGPALQTTGANLNDASGFHAVYASSSATNRPPSGNSNIIGFGLANYTTQMGFYAGDGAFFVRQQIAGTWNAWRRIAERDWVTGVLGGYVAKSDIITPARGGFGVDISSHPANSIYLWDGSAFDRQTLGGTGFLQYSGGSITVATPSGTVAVPSSEGRIYVSTGNTSSAHGWSVYTWPTAAAVNGANGLEFLRLNGAQTGFELHALTSSDLPSHTHSWSQITGGVAEFSSTGESYRVGSRMRVYTADSGYAHIGHWLGHDGTDHINTHPSLPGAAFRYTGSGGFAWRVATTTGEGPVSLATRWQVSPAGVLEIGTIPAPRVSAGTFGSGDFRFPDSILSVGGSMRLEVSGGGSFSNTGGLAMKSFLSFHDAGGSRIAFINPDSSGTFRIRSQVSGRDIIFDAESAERLRILAGGGIAVPQNHVVYLDGGSNTYIQSNSADRVRVVTGGSERFQVNNSGAGFAVALTVPGLTVSGNAVVTGTLTAAGGFDSTVVSLRKYKDGIEDFPLDRAALMALQPRQWTHSVLAPDHLRGRWGAGFVEDEAPDIFRDRGRGYRHTHITAQLVAGWQDHETRIAHLERENADLRRQLAALN